MAGIRNSVMLNMVLNNIAEEVIESVSDDIIELLRNNIEKYTYQDDTVYSRTGEFLEAFEWGKINKNVTGIIREMVYDYLTIQSFDPDRWIHGSFAGDARMNLADILNVDGLPSSLFISRELKPYWDITIKELFNKDRITRWVTRDIKRVVRRYGFKAIKIG